MKRGFSLIELILAIVIIAIAITSLPKIVTSSLQSNEFVLKQEVTLQAKALIGKINIRPFDSTHMVDRCQERIPASNRRQCERSTNWDNWARNYRNNVSSDISFIGDLYKDLRVPIYNVGNFVGLTSNDVPGVYYDGAGILTVPLLSRATGIQAAAMATKASSLKADFATNSFGVNPGMNDIDDFNGRSGNFNGSFVAANGDSMFGLVFTTTVNYFPDIAVPAALAPIALNMTAAAPAAPSNIKIITVSATLATDPGSVVTLRSLVANIGTPSVYKVRW